MLYIILLYAAYLWNEMSKQNVSTYNSIYAK